MIPANPGTGSLRCIQALLPCAAAFAHIVDEPQVPGKIGGTERRSESPGQFRGAPQMILKAVSHPSAGAFNGEGCS
jgi:hypothetical protein